MQRIEKCTKGFYGNENQYVAKATAEFIRDYGKECYTTTLKAAINDGVEYAKSFDETGSAEKAYELLNKYRK